MSESRISSRSVGTFNANEWVDEGDGLFASARTTRATWQIKRRQFGLEINRRGQRFPNAKAWHELNGLPRASVLLLGYAAEMYLKAGLARAYQGCREEMFARDVRRFGHKLSQLAHAVDLPDLDKCRPDLFQLEEAILVGARYPVHVRTGDSHADVVNSRTDEMWDRARYKRLCNLARRIRDHVTLIDQDRHNPAIFKSYAIDNDGYLTFRLGGHLCPRITYRPSSDLLAARTIGPEDIRALLDSQKHTAILHYWPLSIVIEDGTQKSIVHADPDP
ncbi:MAG: hypothetical protein V4475_19795 [Pseudomonadota bacterium]